MLYTFLIVLLVLGIIMGIFQWLGWIVGFFNRDLNSDQRTRIGFFITVFFVFSIFLKGCEWSKGAEKLDKERGDAFRSNNPGYYDLNSSNLGNERPDSFELTQAKDRIKAYDEKMANTILMWIGVYVVLIIIGYIGESVYPLRE